MRTDRLVAWRATRWATTVTVTGSSKFATPRKWTVTLAGRARPHSNSAARSATAATYPPLGPQISQSLESVRSYTPGRDHGEVAIGRQITHRRTLRAPPPRLTPVCVGVRR